MRGGQQKLTKNASYVQISVVTPLLITNVQPDSVAERCGLQVGDKLLGVNQHSLRDKLHEKAVQCLKEVSVLFCCLSAYFLFRYLKRLARTLIGIVCSPFYLT